MGMAVANTRTESASARVTMNTIDAKRRVLDAEPPFEQRVGGDELALEVAGEERVRDDDASEDVSGRDLEKREVAQIGQAGNADERERARLGGNDRDEDGPPRDRVVWQRSSRARRVATRPSRMPSAVVPAR